MDSVFLGLTLSSSFFSSYFFCFLEGFLLGTLATGLFLIALVYTCPVLLGVTFG
jgi:hypothetical protein